MIPKRIVAHICAFTVVASPILAQSSLRGSVKVARATATLNGVFSPRGFFNITVRLYQLNGVQAAKFDLTKSRLTLDFQPGVPVAEKDIRQVMIDAGYKPGPVQVQILDLGDVVEKGPGWVKIKHPRSKNPFVRWFQLNF